MSSQSNYSNIARIKDEIDAAAGRARYPLQSPSSAAQASQPSQQQPPSYGAPQRDAITSVVDGMIGNLCSEIAVLRRLLDTIEQRVLTSGAETKHQLNTQAAVFADLHGEIVHVRDFITRLEGRTHEQ